MNLDRDLSQAQSQTSDGGEEGGRKQLECCAGFSHGWQRHVGHRGWPYSIANAAPVHLTREEGRKTRPILERILCHYIKSGIRAISKIQGQKDAKKSCTVVRLYGCIQTLSCGIMCDERDAPVLHQLRHTAFRQFGQKLDQDCFNDRVD